MYEFQVGKIDKKIPLSWSSGQESCKYLLTKTSKFIMAALDNNFVMATVKKMYPACYLLKFLLSLTLTEMNNLQTCSDTSKRYSLLLKIVFSIFVLPLIILNTSQMLKKDSLETSTLKSVVVAFTKYLKDFFFFFHSQSTCHW